MGNPHGQLMRRLQKYLESNGRSPAGGGRRTFFQIFCIAHIYLYLQNSNYKAQIAKHKSQITNPSLKQTKMKTNTNTCNVKTRRSV